MSAGRRKWVYTIGGVPLPEPIEVSSDWSSAPLRAQTATEELTYGGMRATDGTPINSRKKHRDYCRQVGGTVISDYKEFWAKKAAERESMQPGGTHDRKARREAIARAVHERFRP